MDSKDVFKNTPKVMKGWQDKVIEGRPEPTGGKALEYFPEYKWEDKAQYQNDVDYQYNKLFHKILKEGEWSENRTGIRTKSLFGQTLKFDVREGFPIFTTREMPFKSFTGELECFIQGFTQKQDFLDRNCRWWQSWANPQNVPYGNDKETLKLLKDEEDLGNIYGYQYRNFGGYTYDLVETPKREPSQQSETYTPKYNIVEEKTYTILECVDNICEIKCGSGYIKKVYKSNLVKGEFTDPYKITCAGVGYLGEKVTGVFKKKLLRVWIDMLNRCYNPNDKSFKNYGQRGVYVCKKWHCFHEFYTDVKKLTGFGFKSKDWGGYSIDKDHFSGICYSPETCIWLPNDMNRSYTGLKQFKATSPNGVVYTDISITRFCDKHNLNKGKVTECINKKRKHHKKWLFEYCNQGRLRYTVPVDQLKVLVEKIKAGVDDRRLIVSAWNPTDFNNMGLLPCHYTFQVHLSPCGAYLDLSWNQRSVDLALGANNTLYGILIHLLAHECGRIPRYLVANYGNVHIYENQIEMVEEQLTRETHKLPTLKLKTWAFDSIFDWTHDMVELVDYKHSGKLKFPPPAV